MGNIRYKGDNYTKATAPVLIDKNITENGTYNASSDGADGYKSVNVNVAGGGNNALVVLIETNKNPFKVQAQTFEKITVPEGVTSLYDSNASDSLCYAVFLKELYLPSTLGTIQSNIFALCKKLEKIFINKPEGSIAGAPWGAPATCEVIWDG